MEENFEKFLEKNNISSTDFAQDDKEKWEEMKKLFEQMHPESFKVQKKFLINDWRRKYHLKGRKFE